MQAVEHDVDRVLTSLRNKIRERGFTQLEVQESLSWGRSYISQLLTKQKALRLEQVLMILDVIGVDPCDFFGELYPRGHGAGYGSSFVPPAYLGAAQNGVSMSVPAGFDAGEKPELSRSVTELRSLVRGLVGLLIDRQLIDVDDLATAVQNSEPGDPRDN